MNRLMLALPLLMAVGCSDSAPENAGEPVRARGTTTVLKVILGVNMVDVPNRLITLQGPAGRKGTFPVHPEVRRLSEIREGDTILADYTATAMADLRVLTPEEERAPIVVAEMLDRRPSNQPPGGLIARTVQIVTTIDAVNATAGTATIRGPLDGQVFLKVEDPELLKALQVGRKILVTFDETLVLSVQPGKK